MDWPMDWKAPIWMVLGQLEFGQTNQNCLRRRRRSYSQSLVETKEAKKKNGLSKNKMIFFSCASLLRSVDSGASARRPSAFFSVVILFSSLPPCNYDQWSIHRVPSQSEWWRSSSFMPFQSSCTLSSGVSSRQQWRCMMRSVRKPPQQPITALPLQLWVTPEQRNNNNKKSAETPTDSPAGRKWKRNQYKGGSGGIIQKDVKPGAGWYSYNFSQGGRGCGSNLICSWIYLRPLPAGGRREEGSRLGRRRVTDGVQIGVAKVIPDSAASNCWVADSRTQGFLCAENQESENTLRNSKRTHRCVITWTKYSKFWGTQTKTGEENFICFVK